MSSSSTRQVRISKISLLDNLGTIRSSYVKCIYCTTGHFTEWTDNLEMQCYKCRKTIDVKQFLRGRSKQEILNMIKESNRKTSLVMMGIDNNRW